jgi:hypothetical protein
VTTLAGLGHSLWIFGFLQIFSNIGYYLLARVGEPHLPLMYAATSFELLTSGMGTGAFSVLLLRMTQKRFSATQYALFSSLFALPRLLAGPVAGFAVDAVGLGAVLPLDARDGHPRDGDAPRFVPLGVREPEFTVEEVGPREPLSTRGARGARRRRGPASGLVAFAVVALLAALKTMRDTPEAGFDFVAAAWQVGRPDELTDWVQLVGIVAFAVIGGLFVAAIVGGPPRRGRYAGGSASGRRVATRAHSPHAWQPRGVRRGLGRSTPACVPQECGSPEPGVWSPPRVSDLRTWSLEPGARSLEPRAGAWGAAIPEPARPEPAPGARIEAYSAAVSTSWRSSADRGTGLPLVLLARAAASPSEAASPVATP